MRWFGAIILWYETLGFHLRALFMSIGFGGQGEIEPCAAWRIVLGPQAATMRLNDGPADPKSHAGCREVWW